MPTTTLLAAAAQSLYDFVPPTLSFEGVRRAHQLVVRVSGEFLKSAQKPLPFTTFHHLGMFFRLLVSAMVNCPHAVHEGH